MRPKLQKNRDHGLPEELQRSIPRPVRLRCAGKMAVAGAVALFAGALFAGIWLYGRAANPIATGGITTEGQVTDIERRRGENERTVVSYRYTVDGREYSRRTKLRKRDNNQFVVGSSVVVSYPPSRPDQSWIRGYEPRRVPFWLVPAVPAALMLVVVLIVIALRRQARLIEQGRAALGRVTKTNKVSHGEHEVWRVHYEWKLLSGATRTGYYDKAKNPPAPGTLIPIVYDPNNPRRRAHYPLSLVRVR